MSIPYERLGPAQRLEALLDPASLELWEGDALPHGQGRLEGMPVLVVATDTARARGAIGVGEAELFLSVFSRAREAGLPLLLALDSSGLRVDEGYLGLGAFRRLYRGLLDTILGGARVLALPGRGCFGGASLLACLCEARVFTPSSRLAVSGPGVIEAISGPGELDARDPEAVRALMGGPARAMLGGAEYLAPSPPGDLRERLGMLLRLPPVAPASRLDQEHALLCQRLGLARHAPWAPAGPALLLGRLRGVLPPGMTLQERLGVFRARPRAGGGQVAFLGYMGGGAFGAREALALATEVQELRAAHPGVALVFCLDTVGHAATRQDETWMLSSCLAHLSLSLRLLAIQGHRVVTWILGGASGAVYVAAAGATDRVSALPDATLRVLPVLALERILSQGVAVDALPAAELIACGVVDALLDERTVGPPAHG